MSLYQDSKRLPGSPLSCFFPTFLLLQSMVIAPSLPVVGLDVSKATLAVCYQVDDLVKNL